MLITIDTNYKISTALYLGLALICLFLVNGGIFPAICFILIAALPFIHEGAHSYIAQDHGVTVKEIRFIKGKTETVTEGNLTHEKVFAIAGAGAMIDGVVLALIGLVMGIYSLIFGQSLTIAVGIFIIMIALFFVSALYEKSDVRIAWRAWNNFRAQQEA